MNDQPIPTLMETALGGLLQDIGKFMQRAHGGVDKMNPAARARESVILPAFQGHYSHRHALWTEAFFQWMEDNGLGFPGGVNLQRVRDMAVFHHKPDTFGPLGWLAAEADRLASGMERKQRDEEDENRGEAGGWDRFIRTPLLSAFHPVNLGFGKAPERYQPLAELIPDERLLPVERPATNCGQEQHRRLWDGFTAEFKTLCQQINNLDVFCEGLLSLSERFTFAIPSSTVDLPDISLHDHNRVVAAIAGCLYAWHDRHGSLNDAAAIKNRQIPKFRFLVGDLSGIQHTLFLLANQQVKGVNKILRARSFLMGMLLEAAALRCRQALKLPAFNLIHSAGGRFMLLVPDLPMLTVTVGALRKEVDEWLMGRYLGEIALNLALSDPFAGADLMESRFQRVQENLNRRLEAAKLRAFEFGATGVKPVAYEQGECRACGVRPARHADQRCAVCHDEYEVGGWLPKTRAAGWRYGRGRGSEWAVEFFGDLTLVLEPRPSQGDAGLLSAFRLYQGQDTPSGPWALRFVANYAPWLQPGESYPELDDDEDAAKEVGDIKTFSQLARDALERDRNGDLLGKPFLAVLKADVDRLGMLFGFGLRRHGDAGKDRATLSRFAALSRLLDLFFTGYLQERLRQRHRDTYTVYAGGDDLLLIGPWRQMISLMTDLNEQFHRYVSDNPNITLSAGLALIKANQPLNRAVWEAEARLERAKNAGRDRACLLADKPVSWRQLPTLLERAELINQWLRDKLVSTALIYKVLYFNEQRRRAEGEAADGVMELACANWRARWAYCLARNVRERRAPAEVETVLNQLLGLDNNLHQLTDPLPSARIPVSIALYRNRG